MRCLHFSSPALFTQFAGFRENIVAFFEFMIRHDEVVVRPQLVQRLGKNGGLRFAREAGEGFSHGVIL